MAIVLVALGHWLITALRPLETALVGRYERSRSGVTPYRPWDRPSARRWCCSTAVRRPALSTLCRPAST
ncbi:hypothetical protein ABZT17_14710 [Streptomyces sp. NPDC005648]|uniref:hypothetical protein n=1 Tax=Streptomyces sp. NPDC005648 TaxID=3157044 RepID=UPI0033B620F1